MSRKKKRVYRLDDLAEIANQLGGRIHIELVPVESRPALADKDQPEKSKSKRRGQTR